MPPSHQESAPLAYILALPVKNGPLPEKLKSSESTVALDEYFQPVKNLGIWVFWSYRTTLTLQNIDAKPFKVWCEQTKNIEQSHGNEVSCQIFQQVKKFVQCHVNTRFDCQSLLQRPVCITE